MRKILFLLIICMCLIPVIGKAQLQNQRKNLAIGINGGMNFSSMDFSPRIPLGQLISPSVGFTTRYIVEKYFKMICGIQLEANLSQRGWKENIDDGSGDTYSRIITYAEIPVLAHLAFGVDNKKGLRFIVNLGPQFSYYLSDKELKSETWNTSNRTNGITAQYGKAIERKFEYGLTGGVGVELRTDIGNFLVEGRYYYGLSDVFNNSKKDYFGRSANTFLGARVTYLFDITK